MANKNYSAEERVARKREYDKQYQRKRAEQARYGVCVLHAHKLARRLLAVPEADWEDAILKYLMEETRFRG